MIRNFAFVLLLIHGLGCADETPWQDDLASDGAQALSMNAEGHRCTFQDKEAAIAQCSSVCSHHGFRGCSVADACTVLPGEFFTWGPDQGRLSSTNHKGLHWNRACMAYTWNGHGWDYAKSWELQASHNSDGCGAKQH